MRERKGKQCLSPKEDCEFLEPAGKQVPWRSGAFRTSGAFRETARPADCQQTSVATRATLSVSRRCRDAVATNARVTGARDKCRCVVAVAGSARNGGAGSGERGVIVSRAGVRWQEYAAQIDLLRR